MAKTIIGGNTYEVPELNFVALERAWPFVETAMVSLDPMQGPSAALCIIASGLCEADNFDPSVFGIKEEDLSPTEDRETQVFNKVVFFLKKKLKATEIAGIKDCINDILEEAGLVPAEGEAPPGENPLMETLTQSLLNSSQQDAREEAGAA